MHKSEDHFFDLLDFLKSSSSYKLDLKNSNENDFFDSINLGELDVIGVKLNLIVELLQYLHLPLMSKKTLENAIVELSKKGINLEEIVAVYPNLDNPKFALPYKDNKSHRFLFKELLIPRRYSLKLMDRVMLHIYSLFVRLSSTTHFFHPYCYLILKKNEKDS